MHAAADFYGSIPWGSDDITHRPALVLDFTAETGAPAHRAPAPPTIAPAGTFTRSCWSTPPDDYPVAEVIIWYKGGPLSIVGALTGRPGVREMTSEMLKAAIDSASYRGQIVSWLG